MQPRHAQRDAPIHSSSKHLNLTTLLLFVSIFLAVNLAILVSTGIRIGGDSPRYLIGARNLLEGLPLDERYVFYSGYIAVIALCQGTGAGLPGVIFIQLVFAACAALALYDLGRKLHGHRAGLIAAALFIANPDIARWHAFILTDSPYISLVILSVWSVHTAAHRKGYWYIPAALALGSAASVRPNGLILMAAAMLYLVSRAVERQSLRPLAITAIALTFVLGAITLSRFYQAGRPRRPPVSEWSYGGTGIKPWNLSMPPAPTPVAGGWAEALAYVARHPFDSARLALTRVAIELIHIRPFYSRRHNTVLLAFLLPLYLLALMGLKLNRDRSLTNFIILVITIHFVTVAFTYADWDGRYLLYILALIFLFSSCALVSIIELYLRRETIKTSSAVEGAEHYGE
jgi:hypothetical protein